MKVIPIKTRAIVPPKDDLYSVIDDFCPKLKERDIFVVASKVLAIHQGRCLPLDKVKSKDELIKREAELYLKREESPGGHVMLAVKKHTLAPSAGVDESNAKDHYILWPKDPDREAKNICRYLKKKFSLKKLAVIITDSHCVPLRYGTIGISIGFHGLKPLYDYRGKKDIFNRTMKISRSNIVDGLSAAAVLVMGEGKERQPFALIRQADFVAFTSRATCRELLIPFKEDIFYPLLKVFYSKKR